MSRFPGVEAKILRTLEEEGEMRPPQGALRAQWFWQAASRLQSQGLVIVDAGAGVVRRAEPRKPLPEPPMSEEEEEMLPDDSVGPFPVEVLSSDVIELMEALRASLSPSRYGCELPAVPDALKPRPADDLRSRCEALVARWERANTGDIPTFLRCAVALQEVLIETGRAS